VSSLAFVITIIITITVLYPRTKIHCTIAVDFTSSNGDITSESSLHYIRGDQPSVYEQALRAVGEIIQEYDRSERKHYRILYSSTGYL